MKLYVIVLPALLCWCAFAESNRWQGEDLVEHDVVEGIVHATDERDKYEERLNAALRETRDAWGEALIERGGATYENIKGYLQPLFYSTGKTNTEHGVHNVLYALDGGAPPHIVALADGSRLAANVYQSDNDATFYVSSGEVYGSALERLEGPRLSDDYYPILQTEYTDADGVRYTSESFASWVAGLEHLVAFARIEAQGEAAQISCMPGADCGDGRLLTRTFTDGADATEGAMFYFVWSPRDALPAGLDLNEAMYQRARDTWKSYWDAALGRGTQFNVPEPLVMACQRNLLIQNLMLRWRYSLGSVVYHDSFYQPESSDAMSLLAMYGFSDEARNGLGALLQMSKGDGYYVNWERGEKLSHGAEYYFLTRDDAFIKKHTPAYAAICEELQRQMETDPHGLLEKQRHCGDIPDVDYCVFHQAVCWQGMRNMAVVWGLSGHEALSKRYGEAAAAFRTNLLHAVHASSQRLDDGSLFVPSILLEGGKEVYSPITATRMGSYWNLCMPYAFASGLWDYNGEAMNGIIQFLHNHGATLLGLLRFNYYPVEIGAHHPTGLPGYWTTGCDNVYLPSYLRILAQRDEAERLVLSFYGKLAHGQTRNTFVSGEGDNVGVFPGLEYRSCYGAVCSANNMAFLLPLRLMLVRESFNHESGLPEGLHLAHATPRQWLESGKRIVVSNAPTCFGPVSYTIESRDGAKEIQIVLETPERSPITMLRMKLRPPHTLPIRNAHLENSVARSDISSRVLSGQNEHILVLDGYTGRLSVTVRFQ